MTHLLFWIIFTAYLRFKVSFARDQCTRVIINFEYRAQFPGHQYGDDAARDCDERCEAESQGRMLAAIAYRTNAQDRWYDCLRDALCIYGDGSVPSDFGDYINANGPTEDSYMEGVTHGYGFGIATAGDAAGSSRMGRLFRSKPAKLRDFGSIANNDHRFCICKYKLEYVQFAYDAFHGWGNACDPNRFAQAHNHGNGLQVSLFTPNPGNILGSVFPCFAWQDDMSCTSFPWRILKIDYRSLQAEVNSAMVAMGRQGIL